MLFYQGFCKENIYSACVSVCVFVCAYLWMGGCYKSHNKSTHLSGLSRQRIMFFDKLSM